MTRPDLYAAISRAKHKAMEYDQDYSHANVVMDALDRMEKALRAEVDFAALVSWMGDRETTIDEVIL